MTNSENMDKNPANPPLLDDAALLNEAVREAGQIALKYFGKSPARQSKADGTEVSEADYAVNDHLFSRLTSVRSYAWLSEETEISEARFASERVWIIDPIDGTRGFLKEQEDWTIAAALVENGKPIIGAVYAPAKDEFYAATHGGGATLNGSPIEVSPKQEVAGASIIVGKGLFKSEAWEQPWPEIDLMWFNSMAYRVCLVANGAADATISLSNKSDWDIAGAHIILEEAGGLITDFLGQSPIYNREDVLHKNVVAAGPPLLKALLERTT